ncbi:hypothetical protein SALWKB2_0384 [Snodgrassella alvi wkB2]|nr:hypothetical protein SALWKB2_0384 [Snodgrassella alvi wkB2]
MPVLVDGIASGFYYLYQYFTQLPLPAQNIIYINMLNIINFPN